MLYIITRCFVFKLQNIMLLYCAYLNEWVSISTEKIIQHKRHLRIFVSHSFQYDIIYLDVFACNLSLMKVHRARIFNAMYKYTRDEISNTYKKSKSKYKQRSYLFQCESSVESYWIHCRCMQMHALHTLT